MRKGAGKSRCNYCLLMYKCYECGQAFDYSHQLRTHSQTHSIKTDVTCPVCGDKRFWSETNAVQHSESGHCPCSEGRVNARLQTYRFATRVEQLQPFLPEIPRQVLPAAESNGNSTMPPEYPYHCPQCQSNYHHLSQLMQHRIDVHGKQLFRLSDH